MRRVRAFAAFWIFPAISEQNRQFGIRIDTYSGDPGTFPLTGDPETFPAETTTYRRLDSSENTFIYDSDEREYTSLTTEHWLPEGTDFFVVLLEAYENEVNEESKQEFNDHHVDLVRIAIDGGNTPPLARDDRLFTQQDTPLSIMVLINDVDATSYLNPASVSIVTPPLFGTADPQPNGTVLFTPNPGFVGNEAFTYTVNDEEGITSNEATVFIEVRDVNVAPQAFADAYDLSDHGLLIVPASSGVLENDTDTDNDALTAVLVTDALEGTLSLDPSGSFTYQAGPTFDGTDTFTYRATDGLLESNETTVTLTGTAYDFGLVMNTSSEEYGIGQSFPYTISVTRNPAGGAIPGVRVEHLIPDGLVYLSHSAFNGSYDPETGFWDFDFPANETLTLLAVNVRADIAGNWTPEAEITAGLDRDFDATNNTASLPITVRARYDLLITYNANTRTLLIGEQLILNFSVGNLGGNTAEEVAATFQLPTGLGYVSHMGTGTYDLELGLWTIGNLDPGPFASIQFIARADAAGVYLLTAALTGGLEGDFNAANNESSITITVQ